MKKLIALLLALMMVLVCTAAALADDPKPADEPETVTLKKTYNVQGEGASNPADTLKFVATNYKVENATAGTVEPAISIADVSVSGNTASIVITLPEYTTVGEYYYTITEEDGGVAGVGYCSDTVYMKVQVYQGTNGLMKNIVFRTDEDGQKVDGIVNTYEAGTLTVSKEVTGNFGDVNKEWNFTVVFTAPTDDKVVGNITATAVGATAPATITGGWNDSKTATFTLKNGQSVTFKNIPKGVTYTVSESEAGADGYTTTVGTTKLEKAEDVISGKIEAHEDDTVAVINDKHVDIDTGIALDFVPYVLIMALVLAGVALRIYRRRKEY